MGHSEVLSMYYVCSYDGEWRCVGLSLIRIISMHIRVNWGWGMSVYVCYMYYK